MHLLSVLLALGSNRRVTIPASILLLFLLLVLSWRMAARSSIRKATAPGQSSGTPTPGPAVATAHAGLCDRSAGADRMEHESIGRRREDLLKQCRLPPAPASCDRHGGLAFSELTCVKCNTGLGGLCLECIKQHAAAFPDHNLSRITADASELREQLRGAASASCELPPAVSYYGGPNDCKS